MAEQMLADVEYRTLPDFEGYLIGSDGSIWSALCKKGKRGGGSVTYVGDVYRQLKLGKSGRGYSGLWLRHSSGKQKFNVVHTLVSRAFHGDRPSGCEACHNNGNKQDNRAINLRWDSAKDNAQDRIRHGTQAIGIRQGKAKLNNELVLMIREKREAGSTMSSLATACGVSVAAIRSVLDRKTWTHV